MFFGEWVAIEDQFIIIIFTQIYSVKIGPLGLLSIFIASRNQRW